MVTHFPASSLFLDQKNQTGREVQDTDTDTPVTPLSGSLEKLRVYCTEFNELGLTGFSLTCGGGSRSPGPHTDLPWDWLAGVTKGGIYCRESKQKCTFQVLPLQVVTRRGACPSQATSLTLLGTETRRIFPWLTSIHRYLHCNELKNQLHASRKRLKDPLQPGESLQEGCRPEELLLVMSSTQLSSFPAEASVVGPGEV